MTWIQFILWVTGCYMMYYLVMILADARNTNRNKAGQAMSHLLTFSETTDAQKVALPDEQLTAKNSMPAYEPETAATAVKAEPEIIGSGRVSLRDLFGLARKEMILYTNPVSFYP